MSLKQRKKNKDKNNPDNKNATKKKETDKNNAPPPKNNKLSGREILPYFLIAVSVVFLILYNYYLIYGLNLFLGANARDFDWSPYRWRNFIDTHRKTILLIGGPHRSGTTILWKAVTLHPEIVGFGDTFDTGADYSEGILFQDVYPRFGVGLEFRNNMYDGSSGSVNRGGLGQYALLPESPVHWTKTNRKKLLDDPSTLSRLLNRFGPYWDKNPSYETDGLQKARVWVEKSPQNGVLSSFLEGLYNTPVLPDGTVGIRRDGDGASVTKFLWVTRHPIANSYAHEAIMSRGPLPFETYLKNYVRLHQYMREDERELESGVMWVRLEDFIMHPASTLVEIFSFLGFEDGGNGGSSSNFIVDGILRKLGRIDPDPNGKYRRKWCGEGLAENVHLVEKFDDEIMALDLGYDMKSFCNANRYTASEFL